jgi:molybdenum cofactor cytidylyltransferase
MSQAPGIAAVLLAAGSSSRMGEPKQLLHWGQRTLVEHAADALLLTGCRPVVVVLGHQAERVREVLTGKPLSIVTHNGFAAGLGSSLAAGVAAALMEAPELEAVLVTLCDQPRVDAVVLARLIAAYNRARPAILASSYAGTRGVPAVFRRDVLGMLAQLDAGSGAKALLARHDLDVQSIELPEAADDVDTKEDYARTLAGLRR